jgi:hypothetical protein
LIKNWYRTEAKNKAANAQEARNQDRDGDSLEDKGKEKWRTDPLYGFREFMAVKRRLAIAILVSTSNEVDHWLTKPNLPLNSTPKDIKAYI